LLRVNFTAFVTRKAGHWLLACLADCPPYGDEKKAAGGNAGALFASPTIGDASTMSSANAELNKGLAATSQLVL